MSFSATTLTLGYETYVLALFGLWLALGTGRRLIDRRAAARHSRAHEAGAAEPVSLHPLIDPSLCVGCGACTHACPEGRIIGMIGGKAQLVDPASCIGHGACKTACPVGAIDLVFGSARRGVEIPVVTPQFESTVPGVFIAGELGGMGLIANAIEQGRQAVDSIARSETIGAPDAYDVIIVGGGPAGIAATLAAKEKKLRSLTLEQDTLGGSVARYPRAKLVMTRPANLPLYGRVRLRRVRKEALLELWRKVIGSTGIEIHCGVRVERIRRSGALFDVVTSSGTCRTSTVLLATGRRGSPRRLGIPGEALPKVAYQLADPHQYRGRNVVVVGGGDSALETALALSRQPVASVTLSYRAARPTRARLELQRRFDVACQNGKIRFLPESRLRAIEAARVLIDISGRTHVLPNDAVIVCAGGTLPTALLADIGVQVDVKYGTA